MKNKTAAVALLLMSAFCVFGQPIQRNYYTTNANPVVGGATNGIQILNGTGTNTTLYNLAVDSVATDWPGNAATATLATTATTANTATNQSLPYAMRHARPPGFGMTPAGSYAVSGNNSGLLLAAPKGSVGVIDGIWSVPNVDGDYDLYLASNHIHLRIFSDVDLYTNNTPDVDIPLTHIFHNQFRVITGDPWAVQAATMGWDIKDISTNIIANSSEQQFYMKWRFPFRDGAIIQLTNTLGGTNWTQGYIAAYCSTGTLSAEYSGATLKSKSAFQQNVTASSSNYLFSVAAGGYAVELIGGLKHSQSSVFFQFCDSRGLSLWLDGAVKWQASGLDDLFKSTYGMSSGEYIGDDAGTAYYLWNNGGGSLLVDPTDGTAIFEGFRQFNGDSFRWGSSLVAYTDGEQAMDNLYFTLLYYETQ